ncbi:hypothetical protein [Synechococcus phage DSL-LC03]|nr:hypothetical protein [Synechococcus phage DSL-LC03]
MSDTPQKKAQCMSTIVRITVLSWSAALLTASYAGLLSKMDPTFIATVFTAAAATFGVDTLKKGDKEDGDQPRREPAITAVEPTPEPEPPAELVADASATTGCPNCDPGDSPDYSRASTNPEV